MADQPNKPMDLMDLPLPSRSNVLTEAQDAFVSTSATSFAELPTIAAPKSKAQKQREYRQRIAASRTPAQAIAARKSDAERQRNCRLRKAADSALVSGSLESTTASSSRSRATSNDVETSIQRQLTHQQRQTSTAEPALITVQPGTSSDQIEVQQAQSTWNTKWASSILRFKSTFLDNDFGYACSVCDRLWFKNDLKPITAAQLEVISEWFIKENRRLRREEYEMVCNTCKRSLNKKSMPSLAKVNGFSYPDKPPGLPPLDPITERLISPRLPFMQVRRLRHDFSYGIIGQVINLPVDVQEMAKCLPRQLNEDDVINVNIKRNLAHKSVYISRYMSTSTISAWLTVLQKSSLYRLYEISVDLSRVHPTALFLDDIQDDPSNRIENIPHENTPESEILVSRQHTMIWNEEDCLNITPGHQATPFNIIYDRHAEELSFPAIYFGEPRRFNMGVSVTPYMIATSEIRRRDRRGATPQKILYVAMKILRLRMVDGIYNTFRNVSVTEKITRRMLEDPEFLKEYVIQNLAFMKTVPNSVQYWASRKPDLFAIVRQLGKPTIFLTISANEIRWMKLLTILLKLSKKYPGKTAEDLNTSERCTLVSDDPVTCCIYFYKLVGSLMKMLKSKQSYNPFGKYFVKDYFLRIEFQHRGSPHAHILMWLNDDPSETVSENMPRTIDLVEKLSSVARDDVPNNSIYANQIHKHTFTCTKRGETTCRFGFPYWPMLTTRVLVPIPQSDGRRETLQQRAKELRTSLGECRYACMDEFLNDNGLTYVSYLDIVRSTLRKPTLVFRRNFDELMTNPFNPYLVGEVNSKIDIQFILDEYSCAEYVVDYVNKSARGMGNLRRELTTMMQEHPDRDYTGQLKTLSIKLFNAVEMSAQEAAWYLLRQPMSETSRQVVYIPTVWPTERQCCRKHRHQMDREGIDGDSTDVWTKNIIQRYEERPASLEQVYLAEFASWYANANDFVDEEDDVHVDDDEDSEAVPETRTSRVPKEYRRRLFGRVIRYRRYDINETVNYKREMVLLYVQFRNEMSEIINQNIFLQLFDDNKDTIMERRSLFEMNLNIENVLKELEAMVILQKDENSNLQEEESRPVFVQRSLEDSAENVDDVNRIVPRQGFSIVKKRSNMMTKQHCCELVATKLNQFSTDHNIHGELTEKGNTYTNAQADAIYVHGVHEDVVIDGIKFDKDVINQNNLCTLNMCNDDTVCASRLHKDIAKIDKVENDDVITPDNLYLDYTTNDDRVYMSGMPNDVVIDDIKFGIIAENETKVENDDVITPENLNIDYTTNEDMVYMSDMHNGVAIDDIKVEIIAENDIKVENDDILTSGSLNIDYTINEDRLYMSDMHNDVAIDDIKVKVTAENDINVKKNDIITPDNLNIDNGVYMSDMHSNVGIDNIKVEIIAESDIKVEDNDVINPNNLHKDCTTTDNPECMSNIHNDVVIDDIKVEIGLVKDTIKTDVLCMSSMHKVIVGKEVKAENDDVYNLENLNVEDSPNFDKIEHEDVLLGEDCVWDDTPLLVEARQTTKLSATGVQDVTKVQKDSTQAKVDSQRNSDTVSRLIVNNKLQCHVCPYHTNNENHLLAHLKTHSATVFHNCHMCSYITKHRGSLRNHLKSHSGVKSFSCDICNKAFKQKSSLTAHVRTHFGIKSNSCDICHKAFNKKSDLTVHIRTHSGEKPFSCNMCNKTFNQKSYLTAHVKRHSNIKPFSCDICNKAFITKSHLKMHLRKHSGE